MSTFFLWTDFIVLAVASLFFAGILYYLVSLPNRWLQLGLILCSLSIVWLLYAKLGGMQALHAYRLAKYRQHEATTLLKQLGGEQALLKKLQEKLKQNPNSPRGWYLLGRLYMSFGQLKEAEQAFAKAHAQKPNSIRYTLHWVQMRFTLRGDSLSKAEQKELLDIIRQQPGQPDALAMLAMHAYKQQHFQEAIAYWQILLESLPPDSEASLAVRQAIANAQAGLSK